MDDRIEGSWEHLALERNPKGCRRKKDFLDFVLLLQMKVKIILQNTQTLQLNQNRNYLQK
jgi:hypothetical protein